MIANITQGRYLQGLVLYNEDKVKKGVAELLSIENCIDGKLDTAKSFMLNMTRNSKRKDKFLHVSLNFPVSDKPVLTDQKVRSIALDYMNEMGFPEGHPIIIYKHNDTDHPHIHIVTSKILNTGRPINDSHLKRRSQSTTRRLEKEYNLTQIVSAKQNRKIDQKGRGLNNNILTEVDKILKRYRPKDIDELNRHLQVAQLMATVLKKEEHHQENNVDQNIVFHRIDQNGKRTDKGIKSSSLHTNIQENELKKHFSKNRRLDPRRKWMQKTINGILNYYEKLNIEEFKIKLSSKGITLNHTLDGKGNLVGISYTDLKTDIKFTGEKLGQKFKAKEIAKRVTTGTTIHKPENITDFGLKRIKDRILGLEHTKMIETLLLLGYRIKCDNDKISISDYKNITGEGYRFLTNLDHNIDQNIIKTYVDALKINFIDISNQKLFIKNRITFAQSSIVSQPYPDTRPSIKPINTNTPEVQSSKSNHIQTVNQDEHTVSDFDRKKKKKRGKGLS